MRLRAGVAATVGFAVSGVLGWTACSSSRVIDLVFWPDYLDGRGLECVDEDHQLLLQRAKGAATFSIVADIIGVSSVTSPLLDQIQDTCDAGGCSFVGQRACWALPKPTVAPTRAAAEIAGVLADGGFVVTSDAPHQQVLVRVVFTTQPCSALPDASAGFATCDLLGCVVSGSFDPDVANGPVTLDLDVPMGFTACEPIVDACAQLGTSVPVTPCQVPDGGA